MTRPRPTTTSRAFWKAAASGPLAYPRCRACGTWHGYPRPWSTTCLSEPLVLEPVAGSGSVYAVTVVHRALVPAFADRLPYAHALIELDEGFRVLSLIVGCPPEAARSGMRVRAVIDPAPPGEEQGTALVVFEPVRGS